MTTDAPAKRSLGDELLHAGCTLLVGVFLQLGRVGNLLAKKWARATARSRLRHQAEEMGRQMADAGVGNQLSIQKIRSLPGSAPGRAEALEQHGLSGLETGVPLLGLESAYREGRQALDVARRAERDHDAVAARIWPHGPLGWTALVLNYLLTLAAAVLLAAYLAPGMVPERLARWVGRGAPQGQQAQADEPTAQLGTTTVRVKSAAVGRSEMRMPGQGATAVVNDGLTLQLKIEISNGGPAPVEYASWRGKFNSPQDDAARVVDGRGQSLARIVFRGDAVPDGGVGVASIKSGETVADVLIFAPPEPRFGSLELFLPGENLGRAGETLRIVIPAGKVAVPDSFK